MLTFTEFKARKRKILPILGICNKIKSLKLQWENYDQILHDIRKSVKISKKMISDDYYARKIELCYITLLSGIDNLNEFLKKNYYNIIPNLKDSYKPVIAKKLDKWTRVMRNSLIHGDFFMFGFIFLEGTLYNNEKLVNYEGLSVICDYSIVDENPSFNGLNKEKYFSDEVIIMLRLLYNKNLSIENLKELGQLNYLDKELKLRTDGKMSVENITNLTIENLMKNEEFITYHYKKWKTHLVDCLGQFHFNIALLIKEIYNQHLEYFESSYHNTAKLSETNLEIV